MVNHPYRGLAIVLSFLLPGLGQIYNQQFARGTRFIIAYIISWALSFIVIGWFFLVIVWIWSMVDAYQSTGRVTLPPRRAPRG
ncbi:hypothetical protein ES705_02307 [subsurface metagenome]|nr:hypothetical protein [Clostridia bacterium]